MPAHIGDYAVAAAVVAPDKHGHKRLEATFFDVRGKRLGHQVLAELKAREAPFRNNPRNEPYGSRAYGEVEFRELPEDVFAETLDCASHKSGELLRGDQVADLADGLLLGLLADGAAVHDHEVGVVFARRLLVPGGDKQRLGRLRVAHVHLAAVCVYVELHRKGVTRTSSSRAGGRASARRA